MLNFDLSTLEIEYDYETDDEQLQEAKKLIMGEFEAVMAFYPKSEPPVWVKNLNEKRFENFDIETEE